MASYNILQAGYFCGAGANFQYRSDSLNCINPRAGSHIKTLANKLPGANLRWKIPAQERMRSHGPLMQFSTMASSDKVSHAEGEQQAEILWAQVLYIDGEEPAELFGTIHVTDKSGTQYIFNRSQNETLSIRPNERIPLSRPARAISASDQFSIDVSLMDYNTMSQRDEVSRGQIIWKPSAKDNVYNQPISTEVKGKYGSIELCYAVYSNAVLATIEVNKLINGDN